VVRLLVQRLLLMATLGCALTGCATYDYAHNVKVISFSENLEKGQSVGNIHGEDCTWQILGYALGGAPTVDRAFEHTRNQTDGGSLVGSLSSNKQQTSNSAIRYINNVTTKNDGFDVGLFGKKCIAVTGVGYR
jgi:hypothetical protein